MNKFQINEKYYKWVWAIIFLLFAVVCFTLFYDLYMNWDFIKYSIGYLDEKANTVLGLTGASTSASVAITLIPGDVGTPIASQLANISSYSIIVLAAVHLEKYLITLAAVIALKLLLPCSLVLASLNITLFHNLTIKNLVKKLCTFSLAFVLIIPASVALSTLIENTYHDDVTVSIEQTQQDAEAIRNALDNKDQNVWDKFISGVKGGSMEIINRFEGSLNNFVEAISIMLITSCAIPLITFAVLYWLIKSILQVDLKPNIPPELRMLPRSQRKQIGTNS